MLVHWGLPGHVVQLAGLPAELNIWWQESGAALIAPALRAINSVNTAIAPLPPRATWLCLDPAHRPEV